jgi:haloacetate dehalogenase
MRMLEGFTTEIVPTAGTGIFVRRAGSGPPLLLLHGFPQTHIMWRDIAPILAADFTVVLADLRGYGRSGCPPSSPDHAPYAKRAMAGDMIEMMARLGYESFAVAGHDRGGRVAYRMALDHPSRISRLAVLDIIPTDTAWENADARLALAFWPWTLLAQPAPLPEKLLGAAPDAVIDDALACWGSRPDTFPPEVRAAYRDALRDPDHLHAICEEYRAAVSLDRGHDAADRQAGRRIACPVLALWSAEGGLALWYGETGGPLALWRTLADDVRGEAVAGGHFFPEEQPRETAASLSAFFAGSVF